MLVHSHNHFANCFPCQHILNGINHRLDTNKLPLINPCLQLALRMQVEQLLPVSWDVLPVGLHTTSSLYSLHDPALHRISACLASLRCRGTEIWVPHPPLPINKGQCSFCRNQALPFCKGLKEHVA